MNTKKALGKPNGQAQTGTGMNVGAAGDQAEPNSEPTSLTATGRPPGEEFTPLQLAGIHALLTQPTMAAAGKEIGVSARTINRWSKQRAFRAEYLGQMTELQAELWRQMLSVRTEVWNRFLELMRNNDEKVALRAATWYLDKVLSVPPMLGQMALQDDDLDPNTPPSLRSLLEVTEAVERGNEEDPG